ncbi:MAG: hypothetical protein WC718_15835 [Phycisphaerales bacterium]
MTIERAAIRWGGRVWSLPRPARHHDVIALIHRATGAMGIDDVQGFVTSTGRFVDRKDGAEIALASGQVEALRWPPNLFSEDLW